MLPLRRLLREPPRVGHSHIGRSLRRRRFEQRRGASSEKGKTEEESEADDAVSEHRGFSGEPSPAANTTTADGEGNDGPATSSSSSHVGHPAQPQLRVHAGPGRGEGHRGAGREHAGSERRRGIGARATKPVGRGEETKVYDDTPVRVLEQIHLPGVQQGVHVEVQHQDALQYAHREERSSMQVSGRADSTFSLILGCVNVTVHLSELAQPRTQIKAMDCTEMRFILCTWLGEISSCSFLTVLPGPAWVLFNKFCKE